MPDWDYVQGMADDDFGGVSNPDFDGLHDPAGHCGGGLFGGGGIRSRSRVSDDYDDRSLKFAHHPLTRCNRCGSRDVRWRQQTGKWVLFNLGPGEHVCPIDDPFKVLP